MGQFSGMPTFHRRNGSVKYVPPKRLLEGLRPAVAIPATLFAGLVVAAVALALSKAPREQKWVNLKPQPSWKPGYSDTGEPLAADARFLFAHPFDRARTPTATRSGAGGEGGVTPAAGRTTIATADEVIVEHAMASPSGRSFSRSRWTGSGSLATGVGLNLQRGDRVFAGGDVPAAELAELTLGEAAYPAPEFRETAPDRELRFAP